MTGGNDRAEVIEHLERLREISVKQPAGFLKYPYCVPGGFYQQQWDWDGFFIALHLAGRKPPQPEYLKFWALNFISASEESGRCSGCVHAEGPTPGHQSLVLKPFIAQGAELAARLRNDYAWVRKHYERLVAMSTWREKACRDDSTGLFFWTDAMESGADNNPVVSNDPAVAKATAACDINTFQYLEYLAMERLATATGRPADARDFRSRALQLRGSIRRYLWDTNTRSFWNRSVVDGSFIHRVSYSNFVPLWAGIAPLSDGRDAIEKYLWNDAHMLTPFGLRSLSRQDRDYNNKNVILPYSNWQGPVWPIANYFYFIALMRYGFARHADDLVDRLVRIYLSDMEWCGSLHENYDAETGKGLAPSAAQSPAGVEGGFVGWNLLLQDMIEMLGGSGNLLDTGRQDEFPHLRGVMDES